MSSRPGRACSTTPSATWSCRCWRSFPHQPHGVHDGAVPAGEQEAGVLRLGGQLRAPAAGYLPHVNPGEYFVYGGIAAGITTLGLGLGDLAVRYFYVGLIVIFIRGIVTELITAVMMRRQAAITETTDDEPSEVTA